MRPAIGADYQPHTAQSLNPRQRAVRLAIVLASTFLYALALHPLVGLAGPVAAAEKYFPVKVDQTLFEDINRAKDPANKAGLEKSHAPVLTAPSSIETGKPFTVEVAIGESHRAGG